MEPANTGAAEKSVELERRDRSPQNRFRRSIFGVPVTVTVSIGEQRMPVSDLLSLREQSVVALNSKIDDPVVLKVDGRVIARGDLTETEDGGLAVIITEIQEGDEE